MEYPLTYLRFEYDPKSPAFRNTVNGVLKQTRRAVPTNLTDRILAALDRRKIVAAPIRTVSDMQKAFPLSTLCYNEADDRWFVDARNQLMPLEDLLDISGRDVDGAAIEAFTERLNLRVQTALEATRFDRALDLVDSFARLRNDFEKLIDSHLIDPLLHSITRAVTILAEIGNRDLIDAFKDRYVHIKYAQTDLKRAGQAPLSGSDRAFFITQAGIAERNRQVYRLCKAYEENGGEIEKTAAEIRAIKGVNLAHVIPALLNLRHNHLATEIRNDAGAGRVSPEKGMRLEAKFAELEVLSKNAQVTASGQVVRQLTPLLLQVLEQVYYDPTVDLETRENAFLRALERATQKAAYANFQLAGIHNLAHEAAADMNEAAMEAHLAFSRRIMESHFDIFKKSIAQIQRDAGQLRQQYRQRKLGL